MIVGTGAVLLVVLLVVLHEVRANSRQLSQQLEPINDRLLSYERRSHDFVELERHIGSINKQLGAVQLTLEQHTREIGNARRWQSEFEERERARRQIGSST